jgi:hypothetical protein
MRYLFGNIGEKETPQYVGILRGLRYEEKL